ncbi:GtrA family protein [Actinophytocola sp.]|jgi:putative flippase GtrA|uniref:GtrA family protein n=1 Tax=Actinophytocola sp. TaxID=1872138 RepID=UPI002EDA97FB
MDWVDDVDIAEKPPRPEPTPTQPDAVPPERDVSRLRHLVMFCVVGFVAAVITLTLYTVFRTWWPPLVANLLAVTLSTLFNAEANRRFTFRDRSRSPALEHAQAFVVFGLYCGVTSGALLVLHTVADRPPRWAELVVLLASSGIGTLGRFVLLTTWVFPPRPGPHPPSSTVRNR